MSSAHSRAAITLTAYTLDERALWPDAPAD